ncbi:hypothetical protein [Nocardioides sp. B-3]|uniref:hypothetical protein n=1 Tax=Nocardioides sp. B-3 TaxID=2895565 RepID=UPI00215287A2|nr:hypothetical protein [Nocardioides sp. B-3]UUZ60509.1 hypothetical protein LP418_06450 [Nocardioides sp. B-3]
MTRKERLLTAEEAVAKIQSGANVYIGSACGTPRTVVAALEKAALTHRGTRLVHFLTDGVRTPTGLGTGHEHRAFFLSGELAELVPAGRVEYVPLALTDLPELLRAGGQRLDVAVVQTTTPVDGMVSLGVSVDAGPAAVSAARLVIAEINPAMPLDLGAEPAAGRRHRLVRRGGTGGHHLRAPRSRRCGRADRALRRADHPRRRDAAHRPRPGADRDAGPPHPATRPRRALRRDHRAAART